MTLIPALLLSFAHTGTARAAELTELAPALRGDVAVRYDFASAHADLLEQDATVGQRVLRTHTVTYAEASAPSTAQQSSSKSPRSHPRPCPTRRL